MLHRSFRALAVSALFLSAGCSQGPKAPTTVPVSGTIKYNGQPLAQATVSFIQKGVTDVTARQHPAHATTDDQGRYTLLTFVNPKEFPGAVPGDYAVTVSKVEAAGGGGEWNAEEAYKQMQQNTPKEGSMNAEQAQQVMREKATGPKSAIPTKYNDPKTSDLSATVQPSGAQTFDFDLKD